jgi:hypothetical protein
MAGTRVHVPRKVVQFDDRRGTVYQIVKFDMRGGGTDQLDLGEIPSSAVILDGPTSYSASNFYVISPTATDGSASDRRVSITNQTNNPDGEYTVLVTYRGRNVAGL